MRNKFLSMYKSKFCRPECTLKPLTTEMFLRYADHDQELRNIKRKQNKNKTETYLDL